MIDYEEKSKQDPILEIPNQRHQSQLQKALFLSELYCLPKCRCDKNKCPLCQFYPKFPKAFLLFPLFEVGEFLSEISTKGRNRDAFMVLAYRLLFVFLTLSGRVTNKLSILNSLSIAERSEAKNAKRIFGFASRVMRNSSGQ